MSKNRSSIIIFLAATFLFWISLYLYVPTLPTYIKTKTVNLSMVGLVFSMYGLWMAVVRLLLKRIKPICPLCCSAFLFFGGIMIRALTPSLSFIFSGTVCIGFTFGIVYPILIRMSIEKVDRSQRTTAMGIHQSLYATGLFTGTALSGPIADKLGIRPMFMVTAGFYVLAPYLFISILSKKDHDDTLSCPNRAMGWVYSKTGKDV